jgi:hypothetical protein
MRLQKAFGRQDQGILNPPLNISRMEDVAREAGAAIARSVS